MTAEDEHDEGPYDPNNPNTWSDDQRAQMAASFIKSDAVTKGFTAARKAIESIDKRPGWVPLIKKHLEPEYHGLLPGATFEEIRALGKDEVGERQKFAAESKDKLNDWDYKTALAISATYEREGLKNAASLASRQTGRNYKRVREFLRPELHGVLIDASNEERERTLRMAANPEEQEFIAYKIWRMPRPEPAKPKSGWKFW